ncbi:hypothetical protein QA599_06360 [Haloarculaceae archaeon H-GB1-1]|nr:hypothetical protein [Haloarculaceae archaeon H-GB1-1]
MPMKVTDHRSELSDVSSFDGGFSWIAYPEEGMQRASHALEVDGDVWVVDPVDADGLDAELDDLGDVVGVVILLDRHKRDAAAVARRHDVSVHLPTWMTGVEEKLDAPVERLGGVLRESGYAVHRVVDNAFWQEAMLVDEARGTMVVPEAVGTAPFFCAKGERLGVHPMLRLTPPTVLEQWAPERLLVGHGHPLLEDAGSELVDALRGSRTRAPGLFLKNVRSLLG